MRERAGGNRSLASLPMATGSFCGSGGGLWHCRRCFCWVRAWPGLLWGLSDPVAATSLVPDGFLWVTEAQSTNQGLGVVGLAGFSTFVMINNIRVDPPCLCSRDHIRVGDRLPHCQ